MVQHILPQGFQRIRYYGLHAHVRYATIRKVLATRLPTDSPPDPRGFRILPRKRFADLFQESFGKNPLLCPCCGARMTLESICFSDGTIKDFPLGTPLEIPHESIDPSPQRASRRGPVDRTQRVVSLSLPFL